MFRPSRLFFLAAIVGIAYLIWRRRRTMMPQPATIAPPIAPPPLSASPTAAPAADAPRRIPTRVHRGAPPLRPQPATASAAPSASQSAADAPDASTTQAEEAPAAGDDSAVEVIASVGADGVPETTGQADGMQPETRAPEIPGAPPAPISLSGSDSVPESGAEESLPAGELLDLNHAELDALIALPGIGPVIARRILAYREANGPFATIDELIDIQGVGRNNINEFRHMVKV